jgi:hypothetical protein
VPPLTFACRPTSEVVAGAFEQPPRLSYGGGEVSLHFCEGGDEQVACSVACERPSGKAMLIEARHFVVAGEGNKTVSDVAGRRDAQLATEPSG